MCRKILNFILNFHTHRLGWWILAIISVYAYFITSSPPELSFEITSKTNVYDVHVDAPGLEILFNGRNIQELQQHLTAYTIRITNSGGSPITHDLYQPDFSLGLKWTQGKVSSADVVSASQNFLHDNLKPAIISDREVKFAPVIIDDGGLFIVRALVLHQTGEDPQVMPTGKIGGLDFEGIVIPNNQYKISFWSKIKSLGKASLFALLTAGFTGAFLTLAIVYTLFRKLKTTIPILTEFLNLWAFNMELKSSKLRIQNQKIQKEIDEKLNQLKSQ